MIPKQDVYLRRWCRSANCRTPDLLTHAHKAINAKQLSTTKEQESTEILDKMLARPPVDLIEITNRVST